MNDNQNKQPAAEVASSELFGFGPDGYPTDAMLEQIKEGQWRDPKALLDQIKPYWRHADYGYWSANVRPDGTEVEYAISTCGWSGNEVIIYALKENPVFWAQCWWQSRRGGHYVFIVPNLGGQR